MIREQIQNGIDDMDVWVPVSRIEEKLGMPVTTLQKVLSGKRQLPKKWFKILSAYFSDPNAEVNPKYYPPIIHKEKVEPNSVFRLEVTKPESKTITKPQI